MTTQANRQYVWQWPVRLVHWSLFLSLATLAVTGLYIGRPFFTVSGEAAQRFVMGWTRTIHLFGAIVFSLAVFLRIAWMFLAKEPTSRWTELVPTTRARFRELGQMIRFYAFPRGAYPHRGKGHNALAGLTYLAFYTISIFIILTGFALHSVEARSGLTLGLFSFLVPIFGGVARARWLHHALMWVALCFVMAHVYMVVFVARLEKNGVIDGMVTGWKAR